MGVFVYGIAIADAEVVMNILKHLTLLFVEDQNLLRKAMGELFAKGQVQGKWLLVS